MYSDSRYRIEEIVFDDGSKLSVGEIYELPTHIEGGVSNDLASSLDVSLNVLIQAYSSFDNDSEESILDKKSISVLPIINDY